MIDQDTTILTHRHYNVPDSIDPALVASREQVLIRAGTHALLAERLACDAAQNQALRDLKSPRPVPVPVAIIEDDALPTHHK